jgi:hypothetical protein
MTRTSIPLCSRRQQQLKQAAGSEILKQVQDDEEEHTTMRQKAVTAHFGKLSDRDTLSTHTVYKNEEND